MMAIGARQAWFTPELLRRHQRDQHVIRAHGEAEKCRKQPRMRRRMHPSSSGIVIAERK